MGGRNSGSTPTTCRARYCVDTRLSYQWLADGVLMLHVAIVVFVVGGLVLIVVGSVRAWQWVTAPWFRLAHLAAIAVVVAEAWLGVVCPLTTLEMWLRSRARAATYDGSFIEHWLQRLLYYDAPAWVFVLGILAVRPGGGRRVVPLPAKVQSAQSAKGCLSRGRSSRSIGQCKESRRGPSPRNGSPSAEGRSKVRVRFTELVRRMVPEPGAERCHHEAWTGGGDTRPAGGVCQEVSGGNGDARQQPHPRRACRPVARGRTSRWVATARTKRTAIARCFAPCLPRRAPGSNRGGHGISVDLRAHRRPVSPGGHQPGTEFLHHHADVARRKSIRGNRRRRGHHRRLDAGSVSWLAMTKEMPH